MQQPVDEPNRREDILNAALRVFSKHGFHKASIKQIAIEAGLKSPSLIYWYFKDKDALMKAALSYVSPVIGMVADADDTMLDEPPETILNMMASGFFTAISHPNAIAIMKVFLSESLHNPESGVSVASNLLPVVNFLLRYLQRQIDLGRLRPHDVNASARAFMGTLVIYVLGKEVLTPLGKGLPDKEPYRHEIVEIFLRGLRA